MNFTEEHLRSGTTLDSSPASNNNDIFNSNTKRVNFKEKRRKLFSLFTKHIQNFQNTILISRRRSQQRVRKRQALLRSYYIQQILTMSNRYIEILPTLCNMVTPTEDSDEGRDLYLEMIHFDNEKWLETFRMTELTFRNLCKIMENQLCPDSSKPYRHKIPTEKRVAIALYGLATGAEYRKVAEVFRVSRATACKFMRMFAETLVNQLSSCLIALPKSENEYKDIIEGFAKESDQMAPLCIGILANCELAVERCDTIDWVVVQAYIDDRLLFRKIEVNLNNHTCMFEEPTQLKNLPTRMINQRRVSSFLVSKNANNMPMLPWIMQGYEKPTLKYEHQFNRVIDSLLQVGDKAFNRLLGRWQILQRKTDLETNVLELIIKTCCGLHNLLEECQEEYKIEWEHEIDRTKIGNNGFKCENNGLLAINKEAFVKRDFIAKNLNNASPVSSNMYNKNGHKM